MATDVEQILRDAWSYARDGEGSPAAERWRFALGAQWALGCAGLLSEEQIERCEQRAQAEAAGLGLRPEPW